MTSPSRPDSAPLTAAPLVAPTVAPTWPGEIFDALKRFDVRLVGYVPDAGHAELIRRVHADNDMRPVLLTSEEEGIGLAAGAWLGGKRSVLLMQSSGVGNCVNMLSLVRICRFPFLTIVTMRGEWGEFNDWQVPMGSITADVFGLTGVRVLRANHPGEVGEVIEAGASQAYLGGTPTAILLSQRLIGAKAFLK
jgi:sulfopyruvate decarboxylase alpha subunit